jgi:hypothetical protein
MPDSVSAAVSRKTRVFVSYSRRDGLEFAPQLVAALKTYGCEPTIDLTGIAGARHALHGGERDIRVSPDQP